ncbi:MAG: cobamide remodeling phosphodiesterase CbiR [Oceanidesulfovibrio sp.]
MRPTLAPVLAAPSFVIPGTIPENCAFLEPLVDEVALCFFETRACLEYGADDLPDHLARHALSYHVHLPLDLPEEPDALRDSLKGLVAKVAFLAPRFFVLHPPPSEELLRTAADALSEAGVPTGNILLENVGAPPIAPLLSLAYDLGMGFCLDVGHFLRLGEREILGQGALLERARCLHAYAPDPEGTGRHQRLSLLDGEGLAFLDALLARLPNLDTVVLEVFDRHGFERSMAMWQSRYGEGW